MITTGKMDMAVGWIIGDITFAREDKMLFGLLAIDIRCDQQAIIVSMDSERDGTGYDGDSLLFGFHGVDMGVTGQIADQPEGVDVILIEKGGSFRFDPGGQVPLFLWKPLGIMIQKVGPAQLTPRGKWLTILSGLQIGGQVQGAVDPPYQAPLGELGLRFKWRRIR